VNIVSSGNSADSQTSKYEKLFVIFLTLFYFSIIGGTMISILTAGALSWVAEISGLVMALANYVVLIMLAQKYAALFASEIVNETRDGRKSIRLARQAEIWRRGNTARQFIVYSILHIPEQLAAFTEANIAPPEELAAIIRQLDKQWWNFGWRIRKYVVLRRLSRAAPGKGDHTPN
jgi:hypothetical protein